jgi:hypothetical protein
VQFVQHTDDRLQACPFLPQFLGMLGIVPDFGIFELALDFDQPIVFSIVVKDTPSGPGSAPEGL